MMDADGPAKRYTTVYEFFKRVAVQSARFEKISKEAKYFRASFGGSLFDEKQRNYHDKLADTSMQKEERISTVAAVSTIPHRKWTPRVVAAMESVREEDEHDENENPEDYQQSKNIAIMTASEKLNAACYRMVNKNSCSQVNCEYSHDKALIAAARDKQMSDLTEAKRLMQAGFQATLRTYDNQGAKVKSSFQSTVTPAPMRPVHTDTTPRLSLLSRAREPIIDQHIGQEAACFKRVALMTKHFPEDVLKQGCQTTVTVLCLEEDMKVKAMLDTGCSPNNYCKKEFFDQHAETLSQYLVKSSPERVDLATSDSAHYITQHIMLNLRHVDSRGRVRYMTLKFGILKGLRFDMVIGLYAISFHFMEVIQDLLTLQLESIESTNPLQLSSDETVEDSA